MVNDDRGYKDVAQPNARVYTRFVKGFTWGTIIAVIVLALMGLFLT